MRKKNYPVVLVFLILLSGFSAWAQDTTGTNTPAMAEGLRSNGKIYVVVAVLVTILLGLFLYVIQMDRKITKLEKSNKK